MIPTDYITEWRQIAPWPHDAQVEQDLLISRALVEIFSHADLAKLLAFRGGTALHKLYSKIPARYSEDIDLVQIRQEPIGDTLEMIRNTLDPWLGKPTRDFGEGIVTLTYKNLSEGPPILPLRLKVEINSREHFAVEGHTAVPFEIKSRWFSGKANLTTFSLNELLGTKLHALYQRKKGRDLFDLWHLLRHNEVSIESVMHCFSRYMEFQGHKVSRAEFEENLESKMLDVRFTQDISALLSPDIGWNLEGAMAFLRTNLISKFPGQPWKGREKQPSKK